MEPVPVILEDYLNYSRTIKGLSTNTIKEYRYDIINFLKFVSLRKSRNSSDNYGFEDINRAFLQSIDLNDIYAYLSYVDKSKNNNTTTRSRKISSLRSFFGYLYKIAELIESNPTEKLTSPKKKKRNPVYLTLNESIDLLTSVANSTQDVFFRARNLCILTLFLNCGLRLSELTSIDMDKLRPDSFTVIGKGNKERTIYLNDVCVSSIEEYLKFRPVIDGEKALFISKRRTRMSNRAVQHMIDTALEKAGFDTNIYSTHKLRHTAATLMYKYGNVDIRKLQQILGHASVATTQIYTHLDDEALREAVDKNPLNELFTSKHSEEQKK